MAFDLKMILHSDYELNGRFGTTLGKIGDINRDGFNDIAISAPFEGNGAVYIFLGGPDGLSSKPIQKISAPSELPIPYEGFQEQTAMFGHGISRGVDIDGNGYRDIAIGSPNTESVYIYKTYPVVKVVASIQPSKNELSLDDTRFNIKVCMRIDSVTNIASEIGESPGRITKKQLIYFHLLSLIRHCHDDFIGHEVQSRFFLTAGNSKDTAKRCEIDQNRSMLGFRCARSWNSNRHFQADPHRGEVRHAREDSRK
jgi:hypothetical protein